MKPIDWILFGLFGALAVASAGHALLYKRDPRAALGWIAVCLMFPAAGPLLYFLFGINRVRTHAQRLQGRSGPRFAVGYERPETERPAVGRGISVPPEFTELARIASAVTGQPLVGGNGIEALHNGEQAYPLMLEAIERAQSSVYLATYILETNRSGRRFIDVLGQAAKRGVDVRVLIDGIGELYSLPRAGTLLKRRGVRVARFLPPKLIPPTLRINLRNHRKILVTDGWTGFTGGMNIGDRHLAGDGANPGRVVDMHFRLTGPVVAQIQQTFLEDWRFTTGDGASPAPGPATGGGTAICRAIADGPNEDLGKLATILGGAVSAARRRVAIMTPYFLPPRELIAALQAAALRGVEVVLILPAKNNLPYVDWATHNLLWQLLQWGVRVYYQPPPFVHTKLFVVDDHYAQIGSANLDPRSLRLNFELAVEVYDPPFAQTLAAHFEHIRGQSREISLAEVDGRPLAVRVRDALVWLFSPYL